jgi:hypothetical protein
MNSPCDKNCPERSPTCHSMCERYQSYHKKKLAENAERLKQKQIQMAIADAEYKRYRKSGRR